MSFFNKLEKLDKNQKQSKKSKQREELKSNVTLIKIKFIGILKLQSIKFLSAIGISLCLLFQRHVKKMTLENLLIKTAKIQTSKMELFSKTFFTVYFKDMYQSYLSMAHLFFQNDYDKITQFGRKNFCHLFRKTPVIKRI